MIGKKKTPQDGAENTQEKKRARCETCDYCKFPRTSNDNWGACKCRIMNWKTIDVSVSGGQVPDWCPLNQE